MMPTPDNCPTCGRRIGDYDDDGMEDFDGQRWCRAHHEAFLTDDFTSSTDQPKQERE